MNSKFFSSNLAESDPEIANAIEMEFKRQQNSIELIASENIVSRAVLEAQGSIMTNKYAEGYPGKRYYGGCEFVDIAENLAISRAKELFNCKYVNVQPHSGSQANQAVFMALLEPHDKILGLSLDCGGHLTHGSKVNMSGKWLESIEYNVHRENDLIDYDQVLSLAEKHRPKLIIAGCSAYPKKIDFKKFREIADKVRSYLLVDMAHFAGLVAAQFYDSPLQYADVVTTTTHKTLRGPRGGMILSNNEELGVKFNSAIFPGIQGGPLMHVIAAKAVAFGEALQPQYRDYIGSVVSNAAIMAKTIKDRGYKLVSNGTESHLIVVDLREQGIRGNVAEKILDKAGITCNKNSVPFDDAKPWHTSGIRLGTPACTTRGFGLSEFEAVSHYIADILDAISDGMTIETASDSNIIREIKSKTEELCNKFRIY
jgi:glycine hydroxymethyltransferase